MGKQKRVLAASEENPSPGNKLNGPSPVAKREELCGRWRDIALLLIGGSMRASACFR